MYVILYTYYILYSQTLFLFSEFENWPGMLCFKTLSVLSIGVRAVVSHGKGENINGSYGNQNEKPCNYFCSEKRNWNWLKAQSANSNSIFHKLKSFPCNAEVMRTADVWSKYPYWSSANKKEPFVSCALIVK